jgi:hypothetical protein
MNRRRRSPDPRRRSAIGVGRSAPDWQGIAPYPVADNQLSLAGIPYTGVAVQYARDEFLDSHHVFAQLDAVKFQYGCFLATLRDTGVAVVPAPAPLGSPCS